jgi:hypothetical protein
MLIGLMQLERFLNLLPCFRELKKLELWLYGLDGLKDEGGDSEVARRIMERLHSQKLGTFFDLIIIHVGEMRWGPNCNYMSHVNDQGVYVQWEEGLEEPWGAR